MSWEFRVRWQRLGRHYHLRVFSRAPDRTWALLGSLILDEGDWHRVGLLLNNDCVELLAEDDHD
jgi:hypothetical protein